MQEIVTDFLILCKNVLVSCVTCVRGSALPWIEAELGCMPGPSAADASEMMFSVENLVFGAGDSESCFSLVLSTHWSKKHQDNLVVC